MAGLHPLPTYVHHETTRLTHRDAHTLLSTFLDRAENDAAYRPDSTLSERGPLSSSSGGSPNLTLHHLKRILKGIEGKRVGGDDVNRFFTGDGSQHQRQKSKLKGGDEKDTATPRKRRRTEFEDPNGDNSGPAVAVGEESEGWQDKDDFELAQDDGEVDMRGEERHPGADLDQPNDRAEEQEMLEIEIEGTGKKVDPRTSNIESPETMVKVDKEERKRLKKLKHKEEQKQKAKERSKKSD